MKPKTLNKKLSFSKETVSNLSDQSMEDVLGGATWTCSFTMSCSCNTVCQNTCQAACNTAACVSVATGCYPVCSKSPCPV